jgi:hypothetical protein
MESRVSILYPNSNDDREREKEEGGKIEKKGKEIISQCHVYPLELLILINRQLLQDGQKNKHNEGNKSHPVSQSQQGNRLRRF